MNSLTITTYIKYTYHICAKITWCFVKSLFPQKCNNSCLHGAPLLTAFISKALSKRMFSLQQDHFSAKVSSAHSCCLFLLCFSWSRKSCKVVNAAVKWSSNMTQNANAKPDFKRQVMPWISSWAKMIWKERYHLQTTHEQVHETVRKSFQPSDGPNDPVIRQRALDEEPPTQKVWMVTLVSDHAHEASCKHYCKWRRCEIIQFQYAQNELPSRKASMKLCNRDARVLQVCGRYVVHLKAKQRIRLVAQNGLTYSATFKHFD